MKTFIIKNFGVVGYYAIAVIARLLMMPVLLFIFAFSLIVAPFSPKADIIEELGDAFKWYGEDFRI